MTVPVPLADRLAGAPRLSQPSEAEARFDDWRRNLQSGSPMALLCGRDVVRALLLAIADHSPYLWRLASADADRLASLLSMGPDIAVIACLDDLRRSCEGATVTEAMRHLRAAKARIALLTALADLGGVWSGPEVTEALTCFADAAVAVAVRVLLREADAAGRLRLLDGENPERGCGLVILALGKQGSRELNYSSDIDIIALFDPQAPALTERTVSAPFYVKLVQTLARMLQERTAEGYVVRVDLRLRPDPGSTAVALGLPSAYAYYERYGQNWERAALIKARPVAGDLDLGTAFLRELEPFIWRKYFDYAAIADVHAMKRQIHAVRGHAEVAVAGHDVKLGRGGIREIEFFVQTQQLIFGGRRPHLRGARTVAMLEALHRDGWIDAGTTADLSVAYWFMRTIEHRLQMLNDEQTQRLPSDLDKLDAFALFAGFPDMAAFAAAFVRQASVVEAHYARLFEDAPALDTAAGSLVFTGVEDDPATLQTLRSLGFTQPGAVAEMVRGWHFGRRAAVQTPRAREVLTELVPGLLQAFARSGDPDAALLAFDAALSRMPAAVELLSMLRSNAGLLDLFGDILGVAPRLAATVAVRPHVLDAAIDPATLQSAGDASLLEARIRATLDPRLPAEEFLDRARDMAQEELFLIGVRLLSGADDPSRSATAYSDFAAMMVRAVLAHCEQAFAAQHGRVPGGACVVVAMGKLGSREMTAGSDLDLILIYDVNPQSSESDGARPLDASRYYTRLTQRLVAALTAPTRRGRLYDVDLRLRPSGRQGPLATRLRSFLAYQSDEAETWEHMALTRARVIAGDAELGVRVTDAIRAVLTASREREFVRTKVRDMRALVAREKSDGGAWDLKLAPGGLLDLEFIAQYLVLAHGAEHPALMSGSTATTFVAAIAAGLLPPETGQTLLDAHRLLSNLSQVIRLTVDGRFDPVSAGIGLRRRLLLAADLPDFDVLEAQVRQARQATRAIFTRLIGPMTAGDAVDSND